MRVLFQVFEESEKNLKDSERTDLSSTHEYLALLFRELFLTGRKIEELNIEVILMRGERQNKVRFGLRGSCLQREGNL